MAIKTKVNKWDLIKLKTIGTAKETISKVKRQLSEWEKIIAAYAAQFQKNKQPNQKMGQRTKQTFLQTYRWLTNT